MGSEVYRASTFAPVNIAVIKYWGKRDTKLNLPTNGSISVTLSQDDLRTHTTAACSPALTEDSLTLNNAVQDISVRTTSLLLRAWLPLLLDSLPSFGPLPTCISCPLRPPISPASPDKARARHVAA